MVATSRITESRARRNRPNRTGLVYVYVFMDVRTTENRARRPPTQLEHDNTVDSFENFLLLILQVCLYRFTVSLLVCDVKYIVNSPGTVNISIGSSFGNYLNFPDGYFSVMPEILISRMLTSLAERRTIMRCNKKKFVKNNIKCELRATQVLRPKTYIFFNWLDGV